MVAFLKKPQGCEDFHQIVDFLNASHIRTLDNREIEINAIVDGQDKTITEASVRRHLKLADADGIITLPTTEIFKQLALIGVETTLFPTMLVNEKLSQGEGPTSPVRTQHTPTVIETSPQLQDISITYRKTKTKTRRMGIRIPQSNVPSSVADEAITKEIYDGLGRATTTASSLEEKQGSDKVIALENELKSTKAIYNKTLITLTKRLKKLEKKLKHKRRKVVIDSSEDEEPSLDNKDYPKQRRMIEEIDEDENINLVKSNEYDITLAETLVNIKKSASKDKGKAIIPESEPPKKIKKKKMIQISLDEEMAQRIIKEERESLSIEEWSRLLTEFIDQRKKMLAAKRAEEKINKPPTQAQQRTYMSNYIKNIGGYILKQLKQYSFEEIKMLFDNTMESIRKFVPMESEGQIADSKAGEGSSKEESDRFEHIVDFLNANLIKYALILQALLDGKKVIVNEASIKRDLRLDDVEGTACLPNAAIFEELARTGAKTIVWNEFSSTIASAIIYLANNQKFNFSKYIFESMTKNLEVGVKFLMYPRFVQVFINNQLDDISHHKGIFVNTSLTKKVFANMKRVGTRFSRVKTPLFEIMMVQAPKEVGEIPIDTQETPILTQPSSSQPQRKYKSKRKHRNETETNQAAEIEKLKKRVKKLEGMKKKRTHGLKRLYKRSIASIDQNEGTTLVDDTQGRMNDQDMFKVNNLDGDDVGVDVSAGEKEKQSEKAAKKEVSTADLVTTASEVVM
nr:hypothetical protein [Tanacetum cinerariifolium]